MGENQRYTEIAIMIGNLMGRENIFGDGPDTFSFLLGFLHMGKTVRLIYFKKKFIPNYQRYVF